jgi:hypothetical protein
MALPDLKKRCEGTYRFTLHHAGEHPRVCLEALQADAVGEGVFRVRARVANRGALPTHVTRRGAKLSRLKPVRVTFRPGDDVELLSREGHTELGHLGACTGTRELEWFLRAEPGATCRIDVFGGTGGNLSREVRL